MANFIAHTLRNTPDVIIPGEVRTPEEFFQMNRALKTGHRVLTTFHASNAADAMMAVKKVIFEEKSESMNYKIRDYLQNQKVPYVLIAGDKEISENKIAINFGTELHIINKYGIL